jgi:3-dehydroquinate dehydratase-2
LNLLGLREPEVYGSLGLDEIDLRLHELAAARGAELESAQSNHEGKLVDLVQASLGRFDGLVINPGGLTHSSVSLHDAVAAGPPAVVVHLSNIYAREPFRHLDLIAPACVGGVYGFGAAAYELGLAALLDHLEVRDS